MPDSNHDHIERNASSGARLEAGLIGSPRWGDADLQALTRIAGDGVWEYSARTRAHRLCGRAWALLGYPERDGALDPSEFDALVHPDDRRWLWAKLDACARGESPVYECWHRLRKRDGEWLWVLSRGRLTPESGGDAGALVLGFYMDISERKRIEEVLKESEERFRLVADTAGDAIVLIRHDGAVAYWNPAAEAVFGWSRSEVMGKDIHELLAPSRYRPAFLAGFRRFQATGSGRAIGRTLNVEAVRKDGSEIAVELTVSATKIEDRWCAIAVARDVSARRNMERRLAEGRSQLEDLVRAIPVGIMVVDARTGLVQDANATAMRLIGAPLEHLAGSPLRDHLRDSDGDPLQSRSSDPGEHAEAELRTAAGEAVPVLRTSIPLAHDERPLVLETFVDVSPLKHAQEILERSNRRMARELRIAGDVQRSTLPERCYAEGLDFAHVFRPSQATGGDFFGVVSSADGRSFVYVGDVSGHGLGPALVVSLLVGIIQETIRPGRMDPAEAMVLLQRRLCARLQAMDHYTTLCLCGFNPATGALSYCSAGHPWPLLCESGSVSTLTGESGAPIGLFEDVDYRSQEVTLEPGQTLLLYSDGISQAARPNGERVEEEGLADWCRSAETGRGVRRFLGDVMDRFETELAAGDLDDDVTAVAVARVGLRHFLVPGRSGAPEDLDRSFRRDARLAGLPSGRADELSLALRDALDLAGRDMPSEALVRVSYGFGPDSMQVTATRPADDHGPATRAPELMSEPDREDADRLARLRGLVAHVDWRPADRYVTLSDRWDLS